MQSDPVGVSGGINLYAYAGNDVINAIDPSGLTTTGDKDNPVEQTASRLDLREPGILVVGVRIKKAAEGVLGGVLGVIDTGLDHAERLVGRLAARSLRQNSDQPCKKLMGLFQEDMKDRTLPRKEMFGQSDLRFSRRMVSAAGAPLGSTTTVLQEHSGGILILLAGPAFPAPALQCL